MQTSGLVPSHGQVKWCIGMKQFKPSVITDVCSTFSGGLRQAFICGTRLLATESLLCILQTRSPLLGFALYLVIVLWLMMSTNKLVSMEMPHPLVNNVH